MKVLLNNGTYFESKKLFVMEGKQSEHCLGMGGPERVIQSYLNGVYFILKLLRRFSSKLVEKYPSKLINYVWL
jgi:hypothetical protein